tara:strand:+ start:494 stop:619 length:126 start_codon:yes stop_codon:yes gene_type:complete
LNLREAQYEDGQEGATAAEDEAIAKIEGVLDTASQQHTPGE